jgi:hypothetical protein
VRLLQLTRKELLDEAKNRGGNALVEESWKCDIFRTRKDTYEVMVSRRLNVFATII